MSTIKVESMTDDDLPPLPAPNYPAERDYADAWTEDQMREYARSALAAPQLPSAEPVEHQYRMRPKWHSQVQWSAWKECTAAAAADYQKQPTDDWVYETRALYTSPQPRAEPSGWIAVTDRLPAADGGRAMSDEQRTIAPLSERDYFPPAQQQRPSSSPAIQKPVAWADKVNFENAMAHGKGCDVWPAAGDYEARTGRQLIALYAAPQQGEAEVDAAAFEEWRRGLWELVEGYRMGHDWPAAMRSRIKHHIASMPAPGLPPAPPAGGGGR